MKNKITTEKLKVLALSGSTRKNSTNIKILEEIQKLTKNFFTLEIYDISTLPFFNPDRDNQDPPEMVISFRKKIKQSDGVLICSPEYVFSMPGILKNAIEWTVSSGEFNYKPAAVITASLSGEKTHESLLLVMKILMADIDEKCQLLISGIRSKINIDGTVKDQHTADKIALLISSFRKSLTSTK